MMYYSVSRNCNLTCNFDQPLTWFDFDFFRRKRSDRHCSLWRFEPNIIVPFIVSNDFQTTVNLCSIPIIYQLAVTVKPYAKTTSHWVYHNMCWVSHAQQTTFYNWLHAAFIQTVRLLYNTIFIKFRLHLLHRLLIRLSLHQLWHLATIRLKSINPFSPYTAHPPITNLILTSIHTLTHHLIWNQIRVCTPCTIFSDTIIPIITKNSIRVSINDLIYSNTFILYIAPDTIVIVMDFIFILVHNHIFSARPIRRHGYHRRHHLYHSLHHCRLHSANQNCNTIIALMAIINIIRYTFSFRLNH